MAYTPNSSTALAQALVRERTGAWRWSRHPARPWIRSA